MTSPSWRNKNFLLADVKHLEKKWMISSKQSQTHTRYSIAVFNFLNGFCKSNFSESFIDKKIFYNLEKQCQYSYCHQQKRDQNWAALQLAADEQHILQLISSCLFQQSTSLTGRRGAERIQHNNVKKNHGSPKSKAFPGNVPPRVNFRLNVSADTWWFKHFWNLSSLKSSATVIYPRVGIELSNYKR